MKISLHLADSLLNIIDTRIKCLKANIIADNASHKKEWHTAYNNIQQLNTVYYNIKTLIGTARTQNGLDLADQKMQLAETTIKDLIEFISTDSLVKDKTEIEEIQNQITNLQFQIQSLAESNLSKTIYDKNIPLSSDTVSCLVNEGILPGGENAE